MSWSRDLAEQLFQTIPAIVILHRKGADLGRRNLNATLADHFILRTRHGRGITTFTNVSPRSLRQRPRHLPDDGDRPERRGGDVEEPVDA